MGRIAQSAPAPRAAAKAPRKVRLALPAALGAGQKGQDRALAHLAPEQTTRIARLLSKQAVAVNRSPTRLQPRALDGCAWRSARRDTGDATTAQWMGQPSSPWLPT